jgi:gamma-glutamyltranspeptidase/glutathione hydrolase/leukotriene-C4 hydrolase
VPGELRGLEEAHRRHGRLPWRDIVTPSIKLCRDGFAVTGSNAAAIKSSLTFIKESPWLNATFLRDDGEPYEEGDIMRRPRLADTLELVAENGASALYTGAIADRILALIESNSFMSGIMTQEDLANYRPLVHAPTSTTYHGHTLFSAPPPASGAVLSLILNILETCAVPSPPLHTPTPPPTLYARSCLQHTPTSALRLSVCLSVCLSVRSCE